MRLFIRCPPGCGVSHKVRAINRFCTNSFAFLARDDYACRNGEAVWSYESQIETSQGKCIRSIRAVISSKVVVGWWLCITLSLPLIRNILLIYRYIGCIEWFYLTHGVHCVMLFNSFHVTRGVPRLDGARDKKQVWRPHIRVWGLSEANLLYWSTCDNVGTFRRPGHCALVTPFHVIPVTRFF